MSVNYKIIIFNLVFIAGFFYPGNVSQSAGAVELVKSVHSETVYYISAEGLRHPFPNLAIYQSWYGHDFSRVVSMSDEWLAQIKLGANIKMRSGFAPVKIPSRPEVYAVEPGGVLRHLDNEEVAEFLYGFNWRQRVIDIPEVFFGDYQIGRPLKSTNDLPDGLLYQVQGEANYYWKNKNILQKFASLSAVRENNLEERQALINTQKFYTRDDLISTRDARVFNPAEKSFVKNTDCEARQLKVGFIFVYQGELDTEEVAKVESLREKLPAYWRKMSAGYSAVDTSFPTYLFKDDGRYTLLNEQNRYDLKNEIAFNFYDQSPDEFDFLIIFADFPVGDPNRATFLPVTNYLYGLRKITLDRSSLYGSSGKLKGFISMGDIRDVLLLTPRLLDSTLNVISHEMLHNWSGELAFIDATGEVNKSLLATDGVHWSPWVDFSSPLGGLGWQPQADKTFQTNSALADSLDRNLAPLDLYAMGLLPSATVAPVHYLETVMGEPLTTTITAGKWQEVTIEQIIAGSGQVSCSL